jgi:hypothetical protein
VSNSDYVHSGAPQDSKCGRFHYVDAEDACRVLHALEAHYRVCGVK